MAKKKGMGVSPLTNRIYYGTQDTEKHMWIGQKTDITDSAIASVFEWFMANMDGNSNSDEPCCRCDSKQTNADRIRNMSDEELAEFLITFKNTFGEEYEGEASCMDWLQSEAE